MKLESSTAHHHPTLPPWRCAQQEVCAKQAHVSARCSPPPLTCAAHDHCSLPLTAAHHHCSPPLLIPTAHVVTATAAHHCRSPPPLIPAAHHHHRSPPPPLATTARHPLPMALAHHHRTVLATTAHHLPPLTTTAHHRRSPLPPTTAHPSSQAAKLQEELDKLRAEKTQVNTEEWC